MTSPLTWTVTDADKTNFSWVDVSYGNLPKRSSGEMVHQPDTQRISLAYGPRRTREDVEKQISMMQYLNYWGQTYSSLEDMPVQIGDKGVCKTKDDYPDPEPKSFMIDYKSARTQYVFYNQPCELSEAVCAALVKKDSTLIQEFSALIDATNTMFPPSWPSMKYDDFVKKYLTPMVEEEQPA